MPKIPREKEAIAEPPNPKVIEYAVLQSTAEEIKKAGGERKWFIAQGAIWFNDKGTEFVHTIRDHEGKILDVPLNHLLEKVKKINEYGLLRKN